MVWPLSFLLLFSTSLYAGGKKHHKSHKSRPLHFSPALTKVDECKFEPKPVETAVVDENTAKSEDKHVLIIKQWHLSPKTVTKGVKEKYPQEKNQIAIYKHLADRIKKNNLQMVFSEGCEGEINKDFKAEFNGWDYDSLHNISQTRAYEKVLTLIPLKLEARFDDKIHTVCGDSEKLIQEGNLRLSNLRGWMGFWVRLHEQNPEEKDKLYSEAAAELLKLPKSTPKDQILPKIQEHLKEELAAYKKSLYDRDAEFVKAIKNNSFGTAALVVGGLHADDLKNKLQEERISCEVLEPPGYQKESEQLIRDFEKSVLAGQ